jgi:hypothetical protein
MTFCSIVLPPVLLGVTQSVNINDYSTLQPHKTNEIGQKNSTYINYWKYYIINHTIMVDKKHSSQTKALMSNT